MSERMTHIRPGSGWKRLSDVVYGHTSCIRVHICGLMTLPDGNTISANMWPESKEFRRCIRICGGSRRGAMVWALRKLADFLDAQD